MQVTSDTLFHFTTTLKNLEGIITKKFQLTYCHEKYILDYETHDSYYPMVSFCDIPLALTKDQIGRYGSYAIGMAKEWGIKNNLNPVVYIEKHSLLAKDIQGTLDNMSETYQTMIDQVKKNASATSKLLKSSFDNLEDYFKDLTPENKALAVKELQKSLADLNNSSNSYTYHGELGSKIGMIVNNLGNLFRYIKNYEGTLLRNDKPIPKYRFYDEREWRYVPAVDDLRVKEYLNADQYKGYRGVSKTKPFIENINLSFSGSDIKFLIVKSNKDIPKLIKLIKSVDNLTKNSNDTDVLTTRILTVEQLYKDF